MGGCRNFRLQDIFFLLFQLCRIFFFLISMSLHDIFFNAQILNLSVTSHSKFILLKTNPGNHLYTQCLVLKFTSFSQSNKEFHFYSVYKECISTNLWLVDFSVRLVDVMHQFPIGSLPPGQVNVFFFLVT